MTLLKSIFSATMMTISLCFLCTAAANPMIWQIKVISALPIRASDSAELCKPVTPDIYSGTMDNLLRDGVTSQNGILVKYRSYNIHQHNGLFFTDIDVMISRHSMTVKTWYNNMYIHLQQLNPYGVADGVWSTSQCKGRLIAQPVMSTAAG